MNRRDFIAGLGGAVAWPVGARAQQQRAIPVIGSLHIGSREQSAPLLAGFVRGLAEAGFVVGRNVEIEGRWALSQYERLPALAAELVSRQVNLIVVLGDTPAALAAKAATETIPIIFENGSNPVDVGLVASLNRPGGNVTGVTDIGVQLTPKRLELLRSLLPNVTDFAFLAHPNSTNFAALTRGAQVSAGASGLRLHIVTAGAVSDLAPAFASMRQLGVGALVVSPNSSYLNYRNEFPALTTQYRIPAIFGYRQHPEAGELMSYGTSLEDLSRQVGGYAGRILKGERPADLPVMQPTKFDLVINLKTAKALGLTIPPNLLAITDEVIE
jgi:putative tryptophan/tyrosine transport system substrate-binding protein